MYMPQGSFYTHRPVKGQNVCKWLKVRMSKCAEVMPECQCVGVRYLTP